VTARSDGVSEAPARGTAATLAHRRPDVRTEARGAGSSGT